MIKKVFTGFIATTFIATLTYGAQNSADLIGSTYVGTYSGNANHYNPNEELTSTCLAVFNDSKTIDGLEYVNVTVVNNINDSYYETPEKYRDASNTDIESVWMQFNEDAALYVGPKANNRRLNHQTEIFFTEEGVPSHMKFYTPFLGGSYRIFTCNFKDRQGPEFVEMKPEKKADAYRTIAWVAEESLKAEMSDIEGNRVFAGEYSGFSSYDQCLLGISETKGVLTYSFLLDIDQHRGQLRIEDIKGKRRVRDGKLRFELDRKNNLRKIILRDRHNKKQICKIRKSLRMD